MTGIKLEAGKTYLDRKGEKHGPLVHNLKEVGTLYEYSLGDRKFSASWRADGRVFSDQNDHEDLIEEVVEAETTMRNSPDYNDGTIHGWNGGDCPVHPETVVEVWFRVGSRGEKQSGNYYWGCSGANIDIIAFRVVKEYVEPKVIWVNEESDGIHVAYDSEEQARGSVVDSLVTRIAVKYQEVRE